MHTNNLAEFRPYSWRSLYELCGNGAQGRSRTTDTTIFSRLLYH